MISRGRTLALLFFVVLSSASCAPPAHRPTLERVAPVASGGAVSPLVDDLQERTFRYFWDLAGPENGLIPDRWPTPSFSSVAAIGFGLTSYPIGAEHGWITRGEARGRVLKTLRFLAQAPQGPEPKGRTSYKGFFYHFLDMKTGARFEQVELSTIDTTLLLAGALFCQSYFDQKIPEEEEIRALAEELYRRADWTWVRPEPPRLSMGWHPEKGFIDYEWMGLNEAVILYVLALGSPTHPIDPEDWEAFTSTYQWASFYGQEHVNFAPLFGHQYSHVWIDFRGIRDAYMRQKGIDYFENSRRATLAQRAYAMDNPRRFRGYGANVWGLTACDGPFDGDLTIDGETIHFMTYAARGAAHGEIRDDGTIAPTAAASSIAFAPEIAVPAIEEMHRLWGEHLYGKYGFLDAFNPTLTQPRKTQHGRIVPGVGWFDGDYLGIDQGPIVAMIENHRTGLIWERMRRNPHIVRGLKRAGFTGGWLE
ncbi:MAG TPA: glucoamylase family protein [Thermoanaerobaculia bacterium]|nr:glucoamylase family protein [Thermoanaerobaculia bacterium]